jgi:neutral amino acid transport system permease protein
LRASRKYLNSRPHDGCEAEGGHGLKARLLLLTALVGALLGSWMGPALAQESDPAVTTTTVAPEGEVGEATERLISTLDYDAVTEEGAEPEEVPVEGAEVTVTTEGGDDLGTFESDGEGKLDIPLPGPGAYTAALNPDTLPDGVEPKDAENIIREVTVNPNEAKRLLFPLQQEGAIAESSGEGQIAQIARLTVEGIKFGLVLAMMSVGLSLIFGTTGLVNFAHGELVTIGAVVAWYINSWGIVLPLAAVLAMMVSFGIGSGIDSGLWRPLRKKGTSLIAMLVITIGMSIFLRYFILYIFGGRPKAYEQFVVQEGIDFGFVTIAPKDLWSIVISVVVLTAVGLVLTKTRVGKAIRAVADNRDLAESSGINVARVINTVWGAGAALACLGGVLFSIGEFVDWQAGFRLLLLIFASVTLGGLGTAYGALVGSLIIGILIQVSTIWIPTELKNVGALAVLIIILVVRPQGILGQRERIG